METVKHFLEFEIFSVGTHKIKAYMLLTILLIFVITRFILWIVKKSMFRNHHAHKLDKGNLYAIYQIIKYIIWIVAIALMLQTVGIKVTVLVAGSAALLVGVGLGLQQTFNDILSGIILLSERSIKIDDVLEIDNEVIKIQEIGLRTSTGLTRDDISVIIPNSLITTNKVINWSHQSRKTRFRIKVGVAYGSDIEKVEKILIESTLEHPDITDRSSIEVRFVEFNNSSLDFQVLFFSENVFRIEKVKSDIRKIINKRFTENHIQIPFPQMDLHIKSNETNIR